MDWWGGASHHHQSTASLMGPALRQYSQLVSHQEDCWDGWHSDTSATEGTFCQQTPQTCGDNFCSSCPYGSDVYVTTRDGEFTFRQELMTIIELKVEELKSLWGLNKCGYDKSDSKILIYWCIHFTGTFIQCDSTYHQKQKGGETEKNVWDIIGRSCLQSDNATVIHGQESREKKTTCALWVGGAYSLSTVNH